MSSDTTKPNRPSHRLYQTTTDASGKVARDPIGALWPHSKGGGFNLKLTKQPGADARLVIFPATERKGDAQ